MLRMIEAKGGATYNSPDFYKNAFLKIQKTINRSIGKLTILLLVCSIIFFLMNEKNARVAVIALCAALTLEMLAFHSVFLKTTDNSKCVISKDTHKKINAANLRVCSNTDKYPPGINILFRTPSIQGYEPFILKNYDRYAKLMEKNKNGSENLLFIEPDIDSRLFDLLSVGFLITEKDYSQNPKFELFEKNNYVSIYKNLRAAPIAYFSENIILLDETKILEAINKQDYDYYNEVYFSEKKYIEYINKNLKKSDIKSQANDDKTATKTVEKNTGLSTAQTFLVTSALSGNNAKPNVCPTGCAKILKSSYTDNSARFEISCNKNCIFVLNYIFFPGWKLYVNYIPREILNINYLFMGVVLKVEDKIVEFKF